MIIGQGVIGINSINQKELGKFIREIRFEYAIFFSLKERSTFGIVNKTYTTFKERPSMPLNSIFEDAT